MQSNIPRAPKIGGRMHPASVNVAARIAELADLDSETLRAEWRRLYRSRPPKRINRDLLIRAIAYALQERVHGGLKSATKRKLRAFAQQLESQDGTTFDMGISLKPGARLIREWRGETYSVTVLEDGFDYDGRRYPSLTKIAGEITGAHWSGPRFFGVKRAVNLFSKPVEAVHE